MVSRSQPLEVAAPLRDAAGPPARRRGPWQRLARNSRGMLGAAWLLFFGGAAVYGSAVAPFPPDQSHVLDRLHPPGGAHLLGTDHLGRDILSRTIVGARVSLMIGLLSMLVSILVGTLIGALAGFFGGWLDALLMRLTDA